MDTRIKYEWIEALRSGEYKQGRGTLRSYDNQYCCLGVLCDIAVKHGIADWYSIQGSIGPKNSNIIYIVAPPNADIGAEETETNHAYLPSFIAEWAGLSEDDCDWDGSPVIGGDRATCLNDVSKLTFSEIADRIEDEESL